MTNSSETYYTLSSGWCGNCRAYVPMELQFAINAGSPRHCPACKVVLQASLAVLNERRRREAAQVERDRKEEERRRFMALPVTAKHRHFLAERGLLPRGTRVVQRTTRVTWCYNCHEDLDSGTHSECASCVWIICPKCGACGCGYDRV